MAQWRRWAASCAQQESAADGPRQTHPTTSAPIRVGEMDAGCAPRSTASFHSPSSPRNLALSETKSTECMNESAEGLSLFAREQIEVQLFGCANHFFRRVALVDRLDARVVQGAPPDAGFSAVGQSASASASGIAGLDQEPVTPSTIASGVPPTRVATVGAPAAIDSSSTFDNASFNDGITDTVAAASRAGTSCLSPVNIDPAGDAEPVCMRLQRVLVVLLGGLRIADDHESCVRKARSEDRGGFEKLLQTFLPGQPRHHDHDRRIPRDAELIANPLGIAAARRSGSFQRHWE